MINVDNLKKTYYMGNQSLDALSGVTFEITKGEYVAIMALRIWKINADEHHWMPRFPNKRHLFFK